MTDVESRTSRPLALARWLFAVAALDRRDRRSGRNHPPDRIGLSITEWKPVTGAIPPLTEAQWQAANSKPTSRSRNLPRSTVRPA
jgi:cytochrome c oxidase assembly protein subunit 15